MSENKNESEIDNLFLNSKRYDAQKEIIERLLDDKNLETKTELDNPLRFSCLTMIENILEKHQLINSATILKNFTTVSFKYLISKNRKGRIEYIEALQMLNQINQLNSQTSNPLNPIQQHVR